MPRMTNYDLNLATGSNALSGATVPAVPEPESSDKSSKKDYCSMSSEDKGVRSLLPAMPNPFGLVSPIHLAAYAHVSCIFCESRKN